MATAAARSVRSGQSPYTFALTQDLEAQSGKGLGTFSLATLEVEVRQLGSTVWALVRRPRLGGVAIRIADLIGSATCSIEQAGEAFSLRLRIVSVLGEHDVGLRADSAEHPLLRITVTFTPAEAMRPTFMPRDLYMLDANDDPFATTGEVLACQRGPNSGLVYLRMQEPRFGSVLYFQNFTALNPYFAATGTNPLDTVGGVWPELGYLRPLPDDTEPEAALEPGVAYVVSDAILAFRFDTAADERDVARHFLQLLGAVYRTIERPVPRFRDWLGRAEATLRDLDRAPDATIRHYGHRFIHPYTGAEYPDAMVQASISGAVHAWGKWTGSPHPLEAEFTAGLSRFYDKKLATLRRYLPNVGSDKDADAVDSWYLYHPLYNLGLLALDGDRKARKLFLASMDYAVSAAQHFKYQWPIQYKVTDFSVIVEKAEVDGRGQTDVAGIYAWVMLQAFELTQESRYLDEAKNAIAEAMGLGFHLNYQANLTAWGAAACMRLWRITDRQDYLQQAYVYLASFFHNCEIWESEIGHAAHYSNFMGVTCLQDAPYMAMYECFESFAAFERLLNDSGPALDPAVRMLVSEYCRHALHRAWFYYPDALPAEAVATEQREGNGHVDHTLNFPLEDLYADGQPAGQVGQEVYGAGAAFIFATRAFHRVAGASFHLYCDHFIQAFEQIGETSLSLTLTGGDGCDAALSLVRSGRKPLPAPRLSTGDGTVLTPVAGAADRIDFAVPAAGRLILTWAGA